jgi:hypothetical protein
MQTNMSRFRFVAIALAASAALGLANPAHAYAVYRGVQANPNGTVIWTAASFGVSGGPATLSFFYAANDHDAQLHVPQNACYVKVVLANTAANPAVNDHDVVGNDLVAVGGNEADQPQPFPWTIVFDNDPPGHWSIAKDQISSHANNNPASRVAASGFHNLAFNANNYGVTVVNGTQDNCTR